MVDAGKETFELAMLDEYPVLFTSARIDRKTLPKNLFCYDVRHDDGGQGIACEVKPHVLVNHWGTILSKKEIPIKKGGSYYPMEDMDIWGNRSQWMITCGWIHREWEWRKGTKRMGCSWICEAVLTLEMKRAPPFLCIGCVRKLAVLLHALRAMGRESIPCPIWKKQEKEKER